ncbi:hypothetical protein GW17_00040138 [Ensete ventricosum]|nr:hypothetical protein GW17_00040138 [Ensete ventricosum]
MHPLRFPNSGIRAKAVMRRGGQSPCRADHPRPGRGHGQPEREVSGARKGWQPPIGAKALLVSTTVYSQPGARKGLLPVGATAPVVGVAAPCQGDCQRARATTARIGAATTTATQRGTEGLGHPLEKRMILPL